MTQAMDAASSALLMLGSRTERSLGSIPTRWRRSVEVAGEAGTLEFRDILEEEADVRRRTFARRGAALETSDVQTITLPSDRRRRSIRHRATRAPALSSYFQLSIVAGAAATGTDPAADRNRVDGRSRWISTAIPTVQSPGDAGADRAYGGGRHPHSVSSTADTRSCARRWSR